MANGTNGRIDKLERAFGLTGQTSVTREAWADHQRAIAAARRYLVGNPLALASLNDVLWRYRMDANDPPRSYDIPYLIAFRAALAPYCDLEALADVIAAA